MALPLKMFRLLSLIWLLGGFTAFGSENPISKDLASELADKINALPSLRNIHIVTGSAVLPNLGDRATIFNFYYFACDELEFDRSVTTVGMFSFVKIFPIASDDCGVGEKDAWRRGSLLVPARTLSAKIVVLNPVEVNNTP